MDYLRGIGIAAFIVIPLLVWWAVSHLTIRGQSKKMRAIVSGHDGRLSLSRMQAFAWTMVIFGSYCAAMIVHPRIVIATPEETTALKQKYDAAATESKTAQDALDAENIKLDQAKAKADDPAAKKAIDDEQKVVDKDAADVAAKQKASDAAARKTAEDALAAERTKLDALVAATRKPVDDETAAVATLTKTRDKKEDAADTAKLKWRKTRWVEIPSALLALAGISLASGVFASVIAASNDDGKDPAVDKLAFTAGPPATIAITGNNLGTSGTVRLNGAYVKVIDWKDTAINVEADAQADYTTIAVDTANGKLAYSIIGTGANIALGKAIVKSEWSDLFRDDESPDNVSLMKVQMFGWTVIALVIYCFIFVANLDSSIDTLPVVDATIVLLTGLSQTGYLGGKGASNIKKT